MATRTALDVIKRAMRLAEVYSLGEEPTADESDTGLMALNGMLEDWANSSLLVYVQSTDAITLVASTNSYTLGPTGTVVTTRPVQAVDSSYVVFNSVSYPCARMTQDQYNGIAYKPLTAQFPRYLWYQPDYPDGTLTVYPTPTGASTLNFVSLKALSEFTALTTTVDLPPGYFDALCFNLAVNFGPEFGAQISPRVERQAINTKRSLKRTNTRVPGLRLPAAVLAGRYRSRIIDGP